MPFLEQRFLNFSERHHLEGMQSRLLDLTGRGSDSAGLGQDLRMCVPNRLPNDADAADTGTSL